MWLNVTINHVPLKGKKMKTTIVPVDGDKKAIQPSTWGKKELAEICASALEQAGNT